MIHEQDFVSIYFESHTLKVLRDTGGSYLFASSRRPHEHKWKGVTPIHILITLHVHSSVISPVYKSLLRSLYYPCRGCRNRPQSHSWHVEVNLVESRESPALFWREDFIIDWPYQPYYRSITIKNPSPPSPPNWWLGYYYVEEAMQQQLRSWQRTAKLFLK